MLFFQGPGVKKSVWVAHHLGCNFCNFVAMFLKFSTKTLPSHDPKEPSGCTLNESLYLQNQPLVWDSLRILGDGLYFQLSTYPYYGPTRKVKLTKTHLPFGCLVCLGSASRPLVANQRRFNQVHPIDRTYKGSRPPKVSICFTCGFQMFNPVLYEIWNVNVTSLILSLMAPLQERVIRVAQ